MHIQCTKKMIDFIKPDIISVNTDDDIYAWHVNYQIVLRKKFIVFMNDLTRYCIVLYGLKKSDFKDPVMLLKKAILIAMEFDGLSKDLTLKYVNGIKDISYGKTKNRTMVAQLNRASMDAFHFAYDALYDQIYQPEISHFLNKGFVGSDQWKQVHHPKDKMLEYLALL